LSVGEERNVACGIENGELNYPELSTILHFLFEVSGGTMTHRFQSNRQIKTRENPSTLNVHASGEVVEIEKYYGITKMRFSIYLIFLLFLMAIASNAQGKTVKEEFPVERPPFSKGIFPCSACHEGMETNSAKRELKEEHTDIKLHHAEQMRWCLDCHDSNNRDKLRLVNGDTIAFTESYMLCGQCHGTNYRDWKQGIHGKRTGYFDGKKQYYLCVHCHNPHDPKFKPIKPEPPPYKPRDPRNVR
jgi:uncharacterized CHY-type Zn-finger protein